MNVVTAAVARAPAAPSALAGCSRIPHAARAVKPLTWMPSTWFARGDPDRRKALTQISVSLPGGNQVVGPYRGSGSTGTVGK
jgi:hypothetical protein